MSQPMNCPDCGNLQVPISTAFAEPELRNPKSDHYICDECGLEWDYIYKGYRGSLTDMLNRWDEDEF